MKNICFLYYEGGSGIAVANRMIETAIKKLYKEYIYNKVYSGTQEVRYYKEELVRLKPDIIILQDFFANLLVAALEYKIKNKKTKIVLFTFAGIEIVDDRCDVFCEGSYKEVTREYLLSLHKQIDTIFLPRRRGKLEEYGLDNIKYFYPPLELESNYMSKHWTQRSGICYIGKFINSKTSEEVLYSLTKKRIGIDIYPSKVHDMENFRVQEEELTSILDGYYCKVKRNLLHKEVSRTLNNYKYHLLEAEGDCYSIITLEAMAAGTIPIVICSRDKRDNYLSWIEDWMMIYYETDEDFLEELPRLMFRDFSMLSERLSVFIRNKYNIGNFLVDVKGVI